MGYSIMTVFNSEKEKNEMKSFLEKNFTSLGKLSEGSEIDFLDGGKSQKPTDNLDYPTKKHPFYLGFDYGSGDTEEEIGYYFSICLWMSRLSGKRKKFEGLGERPFVIYDGEEDFVVLDNNEEKPDIHFIKTDTNGFRKMPTTQRIEATGRIKKLVYKELLNECRMIDGFVFEELNRLTKMWKVIK